MTNTVRKVTTKECHDLILNVHYAHRLPSISYAYGLFDGNEMVGCCTFGKPASYTLCNGVCGEEYSKIVYELNRLVLKYNKPNEASFFIAKCYKLLPKPMIIVSFSDYEQNHQGTIYQATNHLFTGVSPRQKYYKLKTTSETKGYRRRARMPKAKIIKEYGEDFVEEYYSTNKNRYVMLLGSKVQKKQMLKALKYTIMKYPTPITNEDN